MKLAWLFFHAGVLVVAVGCGAKVTVDTPGGAGGSSGSAGTGGSASTAGCDMRTTASHICITYDFANDTTGLLLSAELSACKSAGGTPGSCPTTSALGTCTVTSSGDTFTETYYSDTSPPFTVAEAQMACTAGGGTFM